MGASVMADTETLDILSVSIWLKEYESGVTIDISAEEKMAAIAAIAAIEQPTLSMDDVLKTIGKTPFYEALDVLQLIYAQLTPSTIKELEALDVKDKGKLVHTSSEWEYRVSADRDYETGDLQSITLRLTTIE